MPSDERIEQALEALSAQSQAFRSALAATIGMLLLVWHLPPAGLAEKA